MASKKLTDADVRSAKPNGGAPLELWDTQTPGLCLRVSKNRKTWLVRYRAAGVEATRRAKRKDDPASEANAGHVDATSGKETSDKEVGRKQRRYSFGEYPDLNLTAAREQAAEILRIARKGGDPVGEAQRNKAEAKAQPIKTFRDLAEAYVTACERGQWMPRGKRQSERTMKDLRESLDRYVLPELGDLLLADVSRNVVKRLQRDLAARGIGAQGNKAISAIRRIYSWAVVEFEGKLVAINVGASQPKVPEPPRERVFVDDELKLLWETLNDPAGLKVPAYGKQKEKQFYLSRQMAIAVQLSALLLSRPKEIAGIMVSEVNLEQATWRVPADRMKARKAHLVPLPPRAVELLREAIALAEVRVQEFTDGEWRRPKDFPVFPSPHEPKIAIKASSMTHTMSDLLRAVGIEGAILYDLRRTGSTAMTSERLGISHFIRSLVLSHTTETGGGAAISMRYDSNSYLPEKRRALAAWEDLLLEIVGERPRADNVAQFNAGSGSS